MIRLEPALWSALLTTTLAGLATGAGGLLCLVRRPGGRTLGGAMGFAAGVMTAVSLADLLPSALAFYRQALGPAAAGMALASLLCAGMVVAALMERCIPEPAPADDPSRAGALHTALATGTALLLHNLPEGVLTLFAGMEDPQMGLRLAAAVAIHNLPEGVATALPLYYATQSRWKAAGAAFAAGLAEPAAALLAYGLLQGLLTPGFLNGLLVLAGGIMLWVSLAQLTPAALELGGPRTAAAGFGAGAAAMTIGIALLS